MAEAAAAGAIAAPIVGGLIGASEGGKSRKQQRDFLERALAEFQGITTPTGDIILPELAGTYSPEMEQLIQLGPSALENISIDPKFREAQMQALSQLAEVSKGGLTEADLAAMRELRRQVAGEERGRELAIQQEMARRGMAGSGQELAARLLESQAGANREAAGADRLSQIAQNRALQAITQQGALAGNIRGQEFAEKSNVARAMDAISAWNAANQQALQQRNIAAQNQASLRNLAERQRIEEAKAAAQNAAVQQQFQNQLALAGQKAGVYGSQAGLAGQQAGQTAQMWGQIGSGVGTGLAGLYGHMAKPGQVQAFNSPLGITQEPSGAYNLGAQTYVTNPYGVG